MTFDGERAGEGRSNNGHLRVVEDLGDLLTDSVPNSRGGIAWGSDGIIYYRKVGLGIWRVPESLGEAEEVTTLAGSEIGHVWLEALPGMNGILFTRDLGRASGDEIAVLDLRTGETRSLFLGTTARYASTGHVVFTRAGGTLLAAPFDVERLEVTGATRTLMCGIEVLSGSAGYFAISDAGVLLYRPGSAAEGGRAPVWIARDGATEPLDPALQGSFSAPAVSPNGRRVAFEYAPAGDATAVWVHDADQGLTRLTSDGGNLRPFWIDGLTVGFLSDRDGEGGAFYARPVDHSTHARLLFSPPDPEGTLQEGVSIRNGRLVYRQRIDSVSELFSHRAPSRQRARANHRQRGLGVLVLGFAGRSVAGVCRERVRPSRSVRQAALESHPLPCVSGGRYRASLGRQKKIIYESETGFYLAAKVRLDHAFAVDETQQIASWESYLVGCSATPTRDTTCERNYDVSPVDGRLIAIRRSGDLARIRDVIVVNWFQELMQRMGEGR